MQNLDNNLSENNNVVIIILSSILGIIILATLILGGYFLVNQDEDIFSDDYELGTMDIDNDFEQSDVYGQNNFDNDVRGADNSVSTSDIINNNTQSSSSINFDKQKFKLVSHNSFNKEIIVPDNENFVDGFSHPSGEEYIFTDRHLDLLKQKSNGKFDGKITMNVYSLDDFSQADFVNKVYGKVLQNTKDILEHQDFETYFRQEGPIFPIRPCGITSSKIKFIDTPTLKGVRVVSLVCAQEFAPIAENSSEYMFFGISKNGQKHIIFSYSGIGNKDITNYYNKNPQYKSLISGDKVAEIANETRSILKGSPEENFTPTIQELDAFVKSIAVD